MDYKLDVELSAELEPYRSAIEATIKPYIKIELTDNNNPTWWQSKFGGLPYMPKSFDYPQSEAGEYLYLLAQINFAEVPQLEGLPEKGILQFYIANDDMWGLDFQNQTKQNRFRVVYFPNANLAEHDLSTDFSFLSPQADLSLSICGCCRISFQIARSPINPDDDEFCIFDCEEVSNEAYEEYWDKFNSDGHKLFGYPYFTQNDPRPYLSNIDRKEPYILLLQIDSDSNDNGCEILWGDNGVANFFIKQSDLDKLDFTNVLYNWDCT